MTSLRSQLNTQRNFVNIVIKTVVGAWLDHHTPGPAHTRLVEHQLPHLNLQLLLLLSEGCDDTHCGPRNPSPPSKHRSVVFPPPNPPRHPSFATPLQSDSSLPPLLCGSSNQNQMSSEHTSFLLWGLLSPLSQSPVDQPDGCWGPVCRGGGEEEFVRKGGGYSLSDL